MIHFELFFVYCAMYKLKFSFLYGYSIALAPLLKKIIHSLINTFATLPKISSSVILLHGIN